MSKDALQFTARQEGVAAVFRDGDSSGKWEQVESKRSTKRSSYEERQAKRAARDAKIAKIVGQQASLAAAAPSSGAFSLLAAQPTISKTATTKAKSGGKKKKNVVEELDISDLHEANKKKEINTKKEKKQCHKFQTMKSWHK